MDIIHEWEENDDGIIYSCKAYSDGHIERTIKEGYENAITHTEERMLEMMANIQYITELAEINGGV